MTPPDWTLKARALLLPTPLAAIDPEGEAERVAGVQAKFAFKVLTDAEDALLRSCADWAAGAMRGRSRETQPDSPTALLHPLDLTSVREVRRDELLAKWPGWLAMLPERCDSEAAYRKLWHTVMDPAGAYAEVPHEGRLRDYTALAQRSLTAALVGARRGSGSPALLLLGLGPVQEFIQASRRTNDLWGGSYLFSYLSARMIGALAEALGPDAILAPWPRGLPIVEQTLFGEEVERWAIVQPSLPAKVLAIVPDGEAEALAERAKEAALSVWREMGEAAHATLPGDKLPSLECFHGQLDAFLELDAAILRWPADPTVLHAQLQQARWPKCDALPMEPGPCYGALSGVVWQGLSASKLARLPKAAPSGPWPKCTCCGERDQLVPHPAKDLKDVRDFWTEIVRRDGQDEAVELRESPQFSAGEALCAVCYTRRRAPRFFWGQESGRLGLRWRDPGDRVYLRFPSLASVAVAPWRKELEASRGPLQGEITRFEQALTRIHGTLGFTPPGNLLNGLTALGRRGSAQRWSFHDADGQWMDEDAFDPGRMLRDHGRRTPRLGEPDWALFKSLGSLCTGAKSAFRDICRKIGSPPSYVAVLYMDGDRMSAWLNGCHERFPTLGQLAPGLGDDAAKRPVSPALQAELSRRLCRFSVGEAVRIIDEHLGRLIYAGGDDVVAILPLSTALRCADALRRAFSSKEVLGGAATASAGLAIGHIRQPMQSLLREAREAEGEAKKERNQLGLRVLPRSGVPSRCVLPWEFADKTLSEAVPIFGMVEQFIQLGKDDDAPALQRAIHALRGELPALKDHGELFEARLNTLLFGAEQPNNAWLKVSLDALHKSQGPEEICELLDILAFFARQLGSGPGRAADLNLKGGAK